MRSPVIPFEQVRFEVASEILCACCQAPVDRHQPDPGRPGRLLGTCADCGTWFLIDEVASVMVVLPDAKAVGHG